MARPKGVTDDQIIAAFEEFRSPSKVARALGLHVRSIHDRRLRIESSRGIQLPVEDKRNGHGNMHPEIPARMNLTVPDGIVIVFSDAHWWPGQPATPANDALLALCKKLKPKAVIANGDVFDGARISRHPPLGWEERPSVIAELKTVQQRLGEISKAAKGATLIRTKGNHDDRVERFLASNAPEFAHVPGFRLIDHLPDWKEFVSVWINDDVVVKHRYANGIHAAYNNTLRSGKSIVTGHLHSLKVTPWTDYTGTRYGIDTGTLADPWAQQFDYCEDGPRNWRSGFAVLTFNDGRLLPPELCEVVDGAAYFRGARVG